MHSSWDGRDYGVEGHIHQGSTQKNILQRKQKMYFSYWTTPGSPSLLHFVFFRLQPNKYNQGTCFPLCRAVNLTDLLLLQQQKRNVVTMSCKVRILLPELKQPTIHWVRKSVLQCCAVFWCPLLHDGPHYTQQSDPSKIIHTVFVYASQDVCSYRLG